MSTTDRLVIVGGGPAGYSAAKAYRTAGGRGEVVLLTAEDVLPYRRPPLSKEYLRGELDHDELPLADGAWFAAHEIDVRRGAVAAALDADGRRLTLADGSTLDYAHCVLATGSRPVRPSLPGADDPRVLALRSVADAAILRDAARDARSAIVLGSGFIGCEAASSLAARGLDVTLVAPEEVPQEQRLGLHAGRWIAEWLEQDGVRLRLGVEVQRIDDGRRLTVGDERLEADLVLLATGARPDAGLAERAGATVEDGRVVVDAGMRSSHPGLLAAGDLALAHNPTAGRHLRVEHWGEALNMGEVAGRSAAGEEATWSVAPGFWSTIGGRTLKQVAWGDGFDEVRHVDHGNGAFSCWYGRDRTTVGVLTHGADDDYERGRRKVEDGALLPRPHA